MLTIPLNSYEGNYITGPASGTTVLRYCDEDGTISATANLNGSMESVAGVANASGTVAGLMPHPERAIEPFMASTDGRVLLESFIASLELTEASASDD